MERGAEGLKLKIGDKAPYFSLKGTDGKIHNISDFYSKRALVVVFTCNHCPYAQAYEGRIIALAKNFQEQGAQFVAICANDAVGYPEDDFAHMVEKSKDWGNVFPYLQDETQDVARAYDAQCTPEVYVFDKQMKLVYHGRIDDNHRDASSVESTDLRNALVAVMDDKLPTVQMTPAIGCSIKWKR